MAARGLAERTGRRLAHGLRSVWRAARQRARNARRRLGQRRKQVAVAWQAARQPRAALNPFRQKLYWSVQSVFHSVLGEGQVRVTMPGDEAWIVEVQDPGSGAAVRIEDAPGDERVQVAQREGEAWRDVGAYPARQAAVLAALRVLLEARRAAAPAALPAAGRKVWVPLENGRPVPKLLKLGDQWTSALHRNGWRHALEPLQSLHDEKGVLFDGFVEAALLWKDTGRVYREPWVGVAHLPPNTPRWAADDLLESERFRESLPWCRGLFVLSEYHRLALAGRLDVPVSTLLHPMDEPLRGFSRPAFEAQARPRLVQVGYWLRNPNSLYKLRTRRLVRTRLDLGRPWEEEARRHLPPERLDLEAVEVLPRASDAEYDELLSRSVVFLDLLDASANNAILECISRATPVLVNRLPAVVEYLGPGYPLYFDDLDEAGRKADDLDLIAQAHEHLRALPKERFTQEGFLAAVIGSRVYRALWAASGEPLADPPEAREPG